LTADIIELAKTYGRNGYRRVTALLRHAGRANNSLELELVSGSSLSIPLAPPGSAKSSYFFFLQGATDQAVWPFVGRVLAAARQPTCNYMKFVREKDFADEDISDRSARDLLGLEGYAFGPIRNIARIPVEFDDWGRTIFAFIRDPRDVAADLFGRQELRDTGRFVRGPTVANLIQRYRGLADFRRQRRRVKVVRLEDITFGWHRLAYELVGTLGLDLPLKTAYEIASSVDAIAVAPPGSSYRECFDRTALAQLEETAADVLAYFGYAPQEAPSAIFEKNFPEFLLAASERLSTSSVGEGPTTGESDDAAAHAIVEAKSKPEPSAQSPKPPPRPKQPQGLWEPDPELFSRLRPNGRSDVTVLGRRVSMEVSADGCRVVVGQPPTGEKTLALYGCSFTFGEALPNDETFCSGLQSMLPHWRVENHGAPGYSTVQNLIQLRRDCQWSSADYVSFCWLRAHAKRNIADISYLRLKLLPQTRGRPPMPFPRGALGPDGELDIRYVKSLRWDLEGVDVGDFQPDDYYMDLVTAAVFRQAQALVTEGGGRFFITILKNAFSPALRRMVDDAGIPVLDASVEGREFTLLPDDAHPNALCNRLYAERIRDYLIANEAV
jgi:hypothetical protein